MTPANRLPKSQREPRPAPDAVGSLFQQITAVALFLSDANLDRETAWQEARGRVMSWARTEDQK